jgi:putative ABC transport system permease protein
MREDLTTAFRSLRKSPTFTAVALIVLSLGIGAGTAIFSVVDAVVLRGLPFDEHDRLAAVLEHDTRRATTFGSGMTTTQNYLDWRARQEGFEALTIVGGTQFRIRNESGEPASARGTRFTHEFFSVMRIAPLLGRGFGPEHEVEGRHRVAILSYGFWQRHFGGSPEAIGKTIELSEETWEVVGVMPRDFAYPVASERPADLYVPLYFRDQDKVRAGGRSFNFTAIGRLKDSVSFAQAEGQMNRVMESIEQQHPKWSPGQRVRVVSLHHHLVGRVRSWMLMLLGAVTLVLLIACANVANLLLARATTRTREMGIRAALGASRWRLTRGLLVEGLVLSLAGAAIGVLIAYLGVNLIKAWLPAGLPRVAAIGIDVRVLVTAIAAACLTGVVFGVIPAMQSARPDLTTALKDSGRSTTASAAGQRVRNTLVVAEVALAVILLVGAGLFLGSFARLMRVDPGFDYSNVLVLDVGPRIVGGNYQEAMKQGRQYNQRMLEAVQGVPGVELAGANSGGLPLSGSWSRTSVTLPGRGELSGDDDSVDRRTISTEYLQVMRIPLKRGRHLSASDRDGAPLVVLVNEAAASKYWPGRDALGQRLTMNDKEYTVAGIVGDIRHLGPEQPARQEVYVPMAQDEMLGTTLVIRTAGDPLAVLPAVKAAIWSVNKDQRLATETVTLAAYMDRLIAQRRFNMALLVLFGVLGLVIAAVGIYGVMAYIVAQRTSEIGVRMALGATRRDVVGMVLRRAGLLMAIGVILGAAVAWYLSAGVKAFLFQTEPNDIRVFAAAVVTLALAGLAASAIPARRAASVDPMVALRQE